MTREQAKDFLVELGIEEPSKEQIDNYLNKLNGETKKYTDKIEKGKQDAALVDELKEKLQALEDAKLSDTEKITKENETAKATISTLQAQIKAMELKTQLADKGITGEDAESLISSLADGKFDIEVLGKIITTRENAAAEAKEREIANGSTNPNGNNNGGADKGDDAKAKEFASGIAKSIGGDNKASTDIVSNYL